MQYAGAEGLIVWLVIVVISIVFRAIKASGGSVAMPPKQRNPQIPRQRQGMRPQGMRQMPAVPQTVVVPRPVPIAGNQPQLSPQELDRAHQALQSELERVFAQGQPMPVAQPQLQSVEYQQAASHDDGSRHIGGRAPVGTTHTAHVQGLVVEKPLHRLQRLREAYKLTELIGRPRAYDI